MSHTKPVVVIFSSTRTLEDDAGYTIMAKLMETLAAEQDGFLSVHTVRDPETRQAFTVSYWRDEKSARAWKLVQQHSIAQELGQLRWYTEYSVVIASVIRSYEGPHPTQEPASSPSDLEPVL